jgi:hypothetical protein
LGILGKSPLLIHHRPEIPMKSLRNRAHHLIDLLPQADLVQIWMAMETQYYDLYMLRAVNTAKKRFKPGDVLTREEAIEFLNADDTPTIV